MIAETPKQLIDAVIKDAGEHLEMNSERKYELIANILAKKYIDLQLFNSYIERQLKFSNDRSQSKNAY